MAGLYVGFIFLQEDDVRRKKIPVRAGIVLVDVR
jgi:hypothetical protein